MASPKRVEVLGTSRKKAGHLRLDWNTPSAERFEARNAWEALDLASRGCYRTPGCGKAGEPAPSMSRGLSAAHRRRWAAYAMSLYRIRIKGSSV